MARNYPTTIGRKLYFARIGKDGPIKIGVAIDPARRARVAQVGSPWPIVLLRVVSQDVILRALTDEKRAKYAPRTGLWATAAEASLHARFADSRMQGEWFEPVDELVRLATNHGAVA